MHKNAISTIVRLKIQVTFLVILITTSFVSQNTIGQSTINLNNLSSFKDPGKSWHIVGDISTDLEKEDKFEVSAGEGILVNLPSKKTPGKDLVTDFEHGNIDLELDFMTAKGANSGIYLQGMYEVQLFDSWGSAANSHASNGGIYQRWDETKPKGEEGYQGYAPRQQVGKAPGLWQHLKVSFQAPVFDASGDKITNAKILKAELNGVVIHENLILFGPTRGALKAKELAKGPLRFQGDHGAVAFRNIKITHFDNLKPELKDLKYSLYEGKFEKEPIYDSLDSAIEGKSELLTSNLQNRPQNFLLKYTGVIEVKTAGEYNFILKTAGGTGFLRINGEEVIALNQGYRGGAGKIGLEKGDLPFELLYTKSVDWDDPALGLTISGPGIREYLVSDPEEFLKSEAVDPILVAASETPIVRSFMDVPGVQRITHAVSVASDEALHYTYDLNHGTLVQLWKGWFLDATPMWHERGDGSSRPQGSVQYLMKQPALSLAKLKSAGDIWISDTVGTAYRPKGYVLNSEREPVFHYNIYGGEVEDAVSILPEGKGIERKITVKNGADKLFMMLAKGSKIVKVDKGMYLIGDKEYYLKINDDGGQKAIVRNVNEGQELIIPVQSGLSYSIIL